MGFKKKKIKKRNLKLYSIIPFLFLVEWFLNHPSMRYGGYILFALPIFIIVSSFLERRNIDYNKMYFSSIFLILVTLIVFNLRNFERIKKEIKIYNYNIFSSPYFYVPDVKSEIITSSNNLTLFKPKDDMCWASKTPCSYNTNIEIKKYLWMNMIYKKDE